MTQMAAQAEKGALKVPGAKLYECPWLGPRSPLHPGGRRTPECSISPGGWQTALGRHLRPERPFAQRARRGAGGHPGGAPRRRRCGPRSRRRRTGIGVRQQRRRDDRPRARRAQPDLVRTLVAHEPPLMELLPMRGSGAQRSMTSLRRTARRASSRRWGSSGRRSKKAGRSTARRCREQPTPEDEEMFGRGWQETSTSSSRTSSGPSPDMCPTSRRSGTLRRGSSAPRARPRVSKLPAVQPWRSPSG